MADDIVLIGDKDRAIEAQKLALEKTPGLGSRIDIVLTLVCIGYFFGDHDLINTYVTKAEVLIEKGGDWDHRNLLKVYNGLRRVLTHFWDLRASRRDDNCDSARSRCPNSLTTPWTFSYDG